MKNNKELIFNSLKEKYNITIGKLELSKILNVSVSYINKCIMKGTGVPNYKKLGTSKNSKVLWNLADVSEYLADTIQMY